MTPVHAETVEIPVPDGTADAYWVHPEGAGPFPAVLFHMDAFGVRPHLRKMADRLASEGYAVLVPNVFHRTGSAPVFDLPDFIDTASRPEIFEQIRPAMRELTPERAVSDAGAYLDWLAGCPVVKEGPVGTTGYCMGAALALRTAAAHPDRVAAVAGFHGGRLATDQPDSPHLLAGHVKAEVYFGHADQDHSLPQEQIDRLEEALAKAGVTHRCEVYAGATHGYTQADTSAYDEEATERHWASLRDLFGRTL